MGTSLAKLPVDPMFGKVLLASAAMGCAVEAMLVGGVTICCGFSCQWMQGGTKVCPRFCEALGPEKVDARRLFLTNAWKQTQVVSMVSMDDI